MNRRSDAGKKKNSETGTVRMFSAGRDPKGARGAKQYAVGVPLAKLIKRRLNKAPELVMLHDTRSVPAEKFRRLKTVLVNEAGDSPQVIVVTSPTPSEGKTLISMNLALAFAADRQCEVLLLDADSRRPSIGPWLSPVPTLGLTEILSGKIEIDHAILELENSPLKILPGGAPARDSVELISSEFARQMMSTLRRRFSRIIIDTPPIVPFTDADVVGGLSDGILVVARSRSTPQSMLVQALASITSTRILGLILNDTTFSLADRENYQMDKQYYSYYGKAKRK